MMDVQKNEECLLSNRRLWIFSAVAMLLLALESFVLVGFIRGQFAMALGLHIVLMLALAGWICHQQVHYRNSHFSLLLLIFTMGAGPIGTAISLATALVYSRYRLSALPPSEWIASFFAQEGNQEIDQLHERITFGQDKPASLSSVEPFQDILTWGTVLQKQLAIAKVARYFRPAFAPLLLKAAQDSNAAVRVQAATALAKIERHFMMQYMQMEKALQHVPEHDASRLKLAQLYDDYAHAGLLDALSLKTLRQKAIRVYEAYLAHHDHPEIKVRLARLYMRQGEAEKTCDLLRQSLVDGETAAPILSWYMEALFRLEHFQEMREVSKRLRFTPTNENCLAGQYGTEVENVFSAWRTNPAFLRDSHAV